MSSKHSLPSKNCGFSLVELSVSIAIIAMIAAAALSVALTSDFGAKETQTIAKLDNIEEALAAYVAINQRLPCPADPDDALTSGTFGSEVAQVGNLCDASLLECSGSVCRGIVPVGTLQLPNDFAFDGWGRRMFYTTASDTTFNLSTSPDCDTTLTTPQTCLAKIPDPFNAITIEDGNAGGIRTTAALYVLLSAGENGHGAYNRNGTTRINAYGNNTDHTLETPEQDNVRFDASGTITAFTPTFYEKAFTDQPGGEYFDDYVRYRTKNRLIHNAGALGYDAVCLAAEEATNNPGSNACAGADNEENCESFAAEIYNRCLN